MALVAFSAAYAQQRLLAPGVWLLPGHFEIGRQPDGNTVVFAGRTGLIVMDTGRHASQREAIFELARSQQRPVVAIVNSHWHLDHTSGNEALKQAFPAAQVHASAAVERIAKEVWPGSTADLQAYLDSGKASPALAEDIRGDIHAQTHPDAMRPDVVVTASGAREIDGVTLDLHIATDAATEGDVWVFDPRTRILAAGDLVTLPVPFLDTACVEGWRASLKEIEATAFQVVIPGHGAPMDRARFIAYRRGFEQYARCALSKSPADECAGGWLAATADIRDRSPAEDGRARDMALAYVALLRRGGGKSPLCRTS